MSQKTLGNRLFAEFGKPSTDDWKQAATAALKGADFDKKLYTPTYEGITLQPIYNSEDLPAGFNGLPGTGAFRRGAQTQGYLADSWLAIAALPEGSPEAFAKSLEEEFLRGAINALEIRLDTASAQGTDPDQAQPAEVGNQALSLTTLEDFQQAFGQVIWEALPIYWRPGAANLQTLALWAAHLKQKGAKLSALHGAIDSDPFSLALYTGKIENGVDSAMNELASLIAWGRKNMPHVAMLGIDGGVYAYAGAGGDQQLAYLASTTVSYIRELQSRGIKPREVFASLRWTLDIGSNFFMELAKFRAARVIWSNLVAGYGLRPKDFPPRIGARTGLIDKTIFDAHNNILRGATQSFAAILAGVESLWIGPFDQTYKPSDPHSRRLAENIHLILSEEMGLDKIIDPAGGSYAIESITASLAQKAWEHFQLIEKRGGFRKAIDETEIQKHITQCALKRTQRFGQRRDTLIGTNRFAVFDENLPEPLLEDFKKIYTQRCEQIVAWKNQNRQRSAKALDVLAKTAATQRGSAKVLDAAIDAATRGATIGQISQALTEGTLTGRTQITPVCCGRLALPYERLRAHAQQIHAKVLLLCIGGLRQYKVRADWIREFCEAGGIQVEQSVLDHSDQIKEVLSKTSTKAVVICSDDETYPQSVPELLEKISPIENPPKVYLAGTIPDSFQAQWQAAGLAGTISIKTPHLQMIEELINIYQ